MTGDELERAIEFLLKQQSRFNVDMENLKGMQAETSREVTELTSTLNALSSTVNAMASTLAELTNLVSEGFIRLNTYAESERQDFREPINRVDTQAQGKSEWRDIREAINKMIIANASTRELSRRVARLTNQNS